MRTRSLAAGLIALIAASTLAKADDIVSFTISGTPAISYDPYPSPPPNPTETGTFTYDFTTNTVLSNTVSLTDGYLDASTYFTPTQYATAPTYGYCNDVLGCDIGNLTMSGGMFSIGVYGHFGPSPGQFFAEQAFYDGTITPSTTSAVSPEPSSFVLLGTGILGVAGTLRRRYLGARGAHITA